MLYVLKTRIHDLQKIIYHPTFWIVFFIVCITLWNILFSASIALAEYFDPGHPLKFSPSMKDSPMYTLTGITDWGRDILRVYGITTVITGIVFLCVAIPTVYILIRFRARGDETELPPQTHGNHVLEIIWTVIPVILLVLIIIPTWQSIFRQDRAVKDISQNQDVLNIQVIGYQWWWKFVYTDYDVTTANELILPENTAVKFSITSSDVIHSFYIPRFGGKIDAIPGKVNYLVYRTPMLTENAPIGGDYYQGQCMELCGLSHALMRFAAIVRTREAFDQFIQSHNSAPVTQTVREQRGEQVFNQCIACHTIWGTPSADIPVNKTGPDLTNFGNRLTLGAGTRKNNMENLKAWIKNPAKYKPGSLMPALALTDKQIEDVAAYIQFSTAKSHPPSSASLSP